MQYYFAPLEGVTGYVYRNLHRRRFGGADRYYLPFLSVNQNRKFSPREWRDICPEHNGSEDLVPQILGKDAEGFLWAASALRDLGYREINFNLGCPSGTVTAKGKGAGFLGHFDELEAFLDTVFSRVEGPVSIKTRLGVKDPAEFERLIALYNRYPIAELTIHPRVRQDLYRHGVRMEEFAAALEKSKNPVCYNGDLLSLADCDALEKQFPKVQSMMIGRGLLADPAMLVPEKRSRQAFHDFHEELYEAYREMFGNDRNAMMKLKEIWFYHIHLFENHEKLAKRLRRSTDAAGYHSAVEEIYATLPMREHTVPGWAAEA